MLRTLRAPQPAAPEGFDCLPVEDGVVWARREVSAWAEAAVERHGTLYAAARLESAGTTRLEGRAPVYVVRSDTADRVVRHYVRGGMVASFLGDRYLRVGTRRPLHEALASERLRASGVPTPRVLAAAVYLSGPIYRGDLVTEYVPTDGDLAHILFEDEPVVPASTRIAVLRAVGATIRQMATLGAQHPDANAKNFLIDAGASPPRVHPLDLDRCRFGCTPEGSARKMGNRLIASLEKWEGRSGRNLVSEEWEALWQGLEGC